MVFVFAKPRTLRTTSGTRQINQFRVFFLSKNLLFCRLRGWGVIFHTFAVSSKCKNTQHSQKPIFPLRVPFFLIITKHRGSLCLFVFIFFILYSSCHSPKYLLILAEISFFLSFFLLRVSRCEFLYQTIIIMVLVEAFWEILGPVWVAFFLGVIIGWTWKPKWASLGNCKFDFSAPSSPTAFVSSNARTPSFSPALYASWDEDHIGCHTSR